MCIYAIRFAFTLLVIICVCIERRGKFVDPELRVRCLLMCCADSDRCWNCCGDPNNASTVERAFEQEHDHQKQAEVLGMFETKVNHDNSAHPKKIKRQLSFLFHHKEQEPHHKKNIGTKALDLLAATMSFFSAEEVLEKLKRKFFFFF